MKFSMSCTCEVMAISINQSDIELQHVEIRRGILLLMYYYV